MDTNERFDMYEIQLDDYFTSFKTTQIGQFEERLRRMQNVMYNMIRQAYHDGCEDERNGDIKYVGKKK